MIFHKSTGRLLFISLGVLFCSTACPARESAISSQPLGLDMAKLHQARDYALTTGGSGRIIYKGIIALTWGDQKKLYDLKSSSKSIGVTALGLALQDGKMKLEDKAIKFHPDFAAQPQSNLSNDRYKQITLFHLATQTAGFEKPGGYTKLIFAPGTKWSYSDGGPNWLAECITLVYKQDIQELMFERVFEPIGINRSDLRWRNNSYRPHEIEGVARREFGSGVHANVDAMARIGQLYLQGGKWDTRQIIPKSFVDLARKRPAQLKGIETLYPEQYSNASDHYGLLWWNNSDGTLKNVPPDTYWSWGLYDSMIIVIPSLDIVAARTGEHGTNWKRTEGAHNYDVLKGFLEPLAASVKNKTPYPKSRAIKDIVWASEETIVRKATGGDNWPITWGDDDALYTAYGDGWGFEPRAEKKLSLGLARVTGAPEDFLGLNLRSPTAEQIGQGLAGKKASGMLMVDGVLYMWVRNAGNSQLAWSTDRGKNWKWSEWRFAESFGCPTFLNYGKNYEGPRDNFVYIYSQDSDSAYMAADQMIMARVDKKEITDRNKYEFFVRLEANHRCIWSNDISKRGGVFMNPRHCYRSSVSYNPVLKRYLWWQVIPQGEKFDGDERDVRFAGGFGIYDAPEPWGPWTTAFFTEKWDVGPGESASIPTKWIDPTGKNFYMVFSGDDCFSVRKGRIITSTD